jgi:hypothetical protein
MSPECENHKIVPVEEYNKMEEDPNIETVDTTKLGEKVLVSFKSHMNGDVDDSSINVSVPIAAAITS